MNCPSLLSLFIPLESPNQGRRILLLALAFAFTVLITLHQLLPGLLHGHHHHEEEGHQEGHTCNKDDLYPVTLSS